MRIPSPLTLVFSVVVLAAAATWFIPAGQYDTLTYDADAGVFRISDGSVVPATQAVLDSLAMPMELARFTEGDLTRPVKVPGTYRELPAAGQGPIAILMAPVRGVYDAIDIIFMIMMIGAFLRVFTHSGVLQRGMAVLTERFRGREKYLLIVIFLLMAAGGTTFSLGEETLVLYPILVPVLLAAGYDRLTAVGLLFLGTRIGIMGSTISPFTVLIASYAAGVDPAAGMVGRLLMLLALTVVSLVFLVRYAERVRRQAAASLVSAAEAADPLPYESDIAQPGALGGRDRLLLAVFGATFGLMAWGIASWGWWMPEMTALFFGSCLLCAPLLGMPEKTFVREAIAGMGEMVGVSVIIGFARGITVIMNDGLLTDTVLHALTGAVAGLPVNLFLVALLGVFFVLAFFISSSSGLALVSMPIMGALALALGIPGDRIIDSFVYGVGLMYLISPTDLLLPSLAMVNVGYGTWLRFIRPLWLVLLLLAVVAVLLG